MNKKIRLFTHQDLDGIGCAILTKYIFEDINNKDVEISYCGYEDINKKVSDFTSLGINTINEYDLCFITDISVSKDVAIVINDLTKNKSVTCKFVLLDHHPTSLDLNKYFWCSVCINNSEGIKTCGTEMLFCFCCYVLSSYLKNIKCLETIMQFVEVTRDWDTWRWKETDNIKCKQVNDLYYMYEKEKFMGWCIDQFCEGHAFPYFTETDKALLDNKQNEIDKYIKQKNKEMIISPFCLESKDYSCGFVFADRFISELGNKLCELNTDIDFVTMVDISSGKVSYRSIKDDIDLGKIAKLYGGGGHPKASGSEFYSYEVRMNILEKLFSANK